MVLTIDKKQGQFFDELYQEMYYKLKREAYYLVRDEQMVQDILQETFLEAYRKIDVLYKHENPQGWLVNAVRYKSLPYRQKLSERLRQEFGEELDLSNLSELSGVDEYPFLIIEFMETALKKDESELVRKRVLEEQPYKELAKEYGISEGACKMRVKRSLEKLRKVLGSALSVALILWFGVGK